jgi:hypothetical protein
MSLSDDELLQLAPLLDRLDRIEARLLAAETRSPSATTELAKVVGRQAEEIEALHTHLAEMRQKVSGIATSVERRFREIAKEIPAMLESLIAPQLSAIRTRIQADTEKSVEEMFEAFEAAVDKKISVRMASVEKALIDQSGIITTLSQRAIESDANFQRLIAAVEKLCERTDRPQLAFEKHLDEAVQRQPEAPARRPEKAFGPRIVTEEEAGKQRHRRPLTSI